MIQDAENKGGH